MQLFVNPTFSPTFKAELQQQLPVDITVVFRDELPKEAQQTAFQSASFILVTHRPPGLPNHFPI
ncbi:hypothetical protein [Spirosoma telluris]|uniref:hypothetical protein n=1 Tax=Spirosoma telluris TaxID=2183553 RepID=UPI002FC32A89